MSLPKFDERKYYYDEAAVERFVVFCREYIRHIKGKWAGKPFDLLSWQLEVVQNVLGVKKKSDGLRRYRTAYIEVPKKNGKSLFASAFAIYMLSMDGEQGAEVYAVASTAKQAGIVYDTAKHMVQRSDGLAKYLNAMERAIFHESTLSRFMKLANDADSADGVNPSANFFDELHRFAKRDLYDVLVLSTATRSQPLNFITTTAGWDRTTICYELHEIALKVMKGDIVDDSFYAMVYGADIDDDWTDPEVWRKANPSLGYTVSEEFLAAECEKAIKIPSRQNAFKRLHLNIWTEGAERWLNIADWDALGDKNITLEGMVNFDSLRKTKCYLGIDLASTRDLLALSFVFPPEHEDETWIVINKYFMPADNVDQRVEDSGVPYRQWVDEGYIITTPGNIADYDEVIKYIKQWGTKLYIKRIPIDPFQATHMITILQGEGFDAYPHSQHFSAMSGPMRETERLIIGGEDGDEEIVYLEHDANPVTRWMMNNIAPKIDADGRIRPDREKSSDKIDGIVAMIMGISAAIQDMDEDQGPSVYETRGLISL